MTMRAANLRLLAILSGVTLVMVVARTVEMAQTLSMGGGPTPWRPLLATEAAIWAGWTLWAAAVIPLVRRVIVRPGARATSALALIALALLPVAAVPVVSSPVHWLAFPSDHSLAAAWVHMTTHNLLPNLLLGIAMVGVAHSDLSLRRARELEVTAATLNVQLADAQLDALRAQLDPHFLFNALNSIAVLARRAGAADVEQMIAHLAGLLRISLDSFRAQLVTLDTELVALRHYLAIEQVRHGERLVVMLDIADALRGRMVPSFVLQPLVENAIRHGFTDPQRPLHVAVRADAAGSRLRLVVADDGAGLAEGRGARDGVGLGNTRARLTGLYGDSASLEIGPGDGGRGTRVVIALPLDAPA